MELYVSGGFFSQHFKYFIPLFFAYMISEQLDVILIFVPLQVRFFCCCCFHFCFFLWLLSVLFSLSFIFCSLNMPRLGLYPLWCSLSFLHLWLVGWCLTLIRGKFSFIIISNIASVPLSLSSPSGFPITNMCYTFCNCPTVLGYSLLSSPSPFSLCFSVLEVSVDILASSEILFYRTSLILNLSYIIFPV